MPSAPSPDGQGWDEVVIFAAMDINCSEKELSILKKVAAAAQEMEMPCYLIGGFVRDKIIGRPTKDADIVCVGDGLQLADAVAKKFKPRAKGQLF